MNGVDKHSTLQSHSTQLTSGPSHELRDTGVRVDMSGMPKLAPVPLQRANDAAFFMLSIGIGLLAYLIIVGEMS